MTCDRYQFFRFQHLHNHLQDKIEYMFESRFHMLPNMIPFSRPTTDKPYQSTFLFFRIYHRYHLDNAGLEHSSVIWNTFELIFFLQFHKLWSICRLSNLPILDMILLVVYWVLLYCIFLRMKKCHNAATIVGNNMLSESITAKGQAGMFHCDTFTYSTQKIKFAEA